MRKQPSEGFFKKCYGKFHKIRKKTSVPEKRDSNARDSTKSVRTLFYRTPPEDYF